MGLTKEDYLKAITAVNLGACNLSGLALSLVEVMPRIWEEARERGEGTDYVNSHQIVTLYLHQMLHLNDLDSELFCDAYDYCKAKAEETSA